MYLYKEYRFKIIKNYNRIYISQGLNLLDRVNNKLLNDFNYNLIN